jgi:hypothetical protein
MIPVYVRESARLPLALPESGKLGDKMGNGINAVPDHYFSAEGPVGRYIAAK